MDPIHTHPPGGSPGESPVEKVSDKSPRLPAAIQSTADKLDALAAKSDSFSRSTHRSDTSHLLKIWETLDPTNRFAHADKILPIITKLQGIMYNPELSMISELLTRHPPISIAVDHPGTIPTKPLDLKGPVGSLTNFKKIEARLLDPTHLSPQELTLFRREFTLFFKSRKFIGSLDFAFKLKEIADKLGLDDLAFEIRTHINSYMEELKAAEKEAKS